MEFFLPWCIRKIWFLSVIMPTGSGKSLCYQLPGLMMNGVTLVISPLIALMKDQVDALEARGLPATFVNSSLGMDEMGARIAGLRQGKFKLMYVAPERFRSQRFLEALAQVDVSLVAVDEAHCISQWGHDFRPDYLRLRQVVETLPQARIMALTATATPEVRADAIKQLGLGEAQREKPSVLVFGFERPNLHLAVTRASSHAAKLQRLRAVLADYPTGLVYCSTRKQTERVHKMLSQAGTPCRIYHGGLDDNERHDVQDAFMSGKVPVVVATNAFGMGVDRADLRCVIHWDIPGSVEAYYQEIGRAGRDGKPSRCELLFNYADVHTQRFFIDGANPTRADVQSIWKTVRSACRFGPVTRSGQEWADAVGTVRNEMTIRSVMAILERAGMIHRKIDHGSRSYTTDVVEGAGLNELEDQLAVLDEKRRRDEAKLKAMLAYVDAHDCRHAHILRYFGELDAAATCEACDRCKADNAGEARELTDAEWEVIQKVLSCAARLRGRFGVARLAQVLIGSKAKPVLERGLDQLSTYGLLQGHGESYVRSVIDALVQDGSLGIPPGEYPVVELTQRGREVMWKRIQPRVTLPEKSVSAAKTGKAALDGRVDAELLSTLKKWRSRTAGERCVPAYLVMNNRTLDAIAIVQPASLAELEAVRGMGPVSVEKYGDEILQILDRHRGS